MKKSWKKITYLLFLISLSATLMGGLLSNFRDDLKDNKKSNNSSSSSKHRMDEDEKKNKNESYDDKDFIASGGRGKRNSGLQIFCQYPYQYENVPFNFKPSSGGKFLPDNKNWSLAMTVEYQRFDDQLNAITLDLDLAFFSRLRTKITYNSLQEEIFNYKDSMTLFNVLLGIDLIALDNFIFGVRIGFQKVTDLDLNMFAYDLYMQFYPIKPLIFDFQLTGARKDDVTTREFKARLGFMFGGNNIYDFGIGYSWLKLGSAAGINGMNFSVRFWM